MLNSNEHNNNSITFGILENTLIRVFENDVDKYIPIKQIKKGTCIINDNQSAFVKCVIKTKYSGIICKKIFDYGNNNIITIGIIPYHPIKYNYDTNANNDWIFPNNTNLFEIENVNDVYIYNFFLESGEDLHQIELYGGFSACTFNHNMEGPIISHNYFGTYNVQNDFEKHPDWENGYIQIDSIKVICDNYTNQIIGIDY